MATGKIKFFNANKNFGFIEREGADDIYVNKKQWLGPGTPQIGQEVTFDVGQYRGKTEAQNVRPINTEVQKAKPTTSIPKKPSNTEYRFLNPYNFVRFLERPRPEDHILGNSPPPPHDRYVGLTGRIECEVEAVTPLFVSDSHGVEDDQGHKTYRFFQYDGKPALPASSLRGMVRSVFEAVTNSCLGVFDNVVLSEHFASSKAPWLVPARVERNGEEWQLRLLTGTSALKIGGEPEDKQYAAWLHCYWPIKPSKTLTKMKGLNRKTRRFQERTQRGSEVTLGEIKHGQESLALLKATEHPHPQIKFWDVVSLSNNRIELEKLKTKLNNQHQIIVKGWVSLNNQNIEAKHSERFFFRHPSNKVGPEIVELTKPVRDAYEALIADYQKRHRENIKSRLRDNVPPSKPITNRKGNKEAGFSRFVYDLEEKQLKGGELVYAFLAEESTVERPIVKFIVPVSVPRVSYENSTGQLLRKSLRHCFEYNSLCPACRTFGWVWKPKDKDDKSPKDKSVAYAGRVQFIHGKLTHNTGTLEETPLVILSSPKPTTTLFYLLKNGQPDGKVNYNDNNAQLRGRKVYRHHGGQLNPDEYKRAPNKDQNRTVRGALKEGAKFTFTIDFENLADVELGALLWALELDEGMHHRLGYAKPLGFGSVGIKVDKLEMMHPGQRYAQLEAWQDGWQPIPTEKIEDWKALFKKTMEDLYGKHFTDLENIQDLQILFSEPEKLLPIHYPRPEPEPSSDEENFEWFKEAREKKQTLPLPSGDDNESLPIFGRKKSKRK